MLSYLLAGTVIGPLVSQSFLDLCTLLIFIIFAVQSFKKNRFAFSLRKPYLFEYGFIFYVLIIIAEFIILGITDQESWLRLHKFYWIINFYLLAWALARLQLTSEKLITFFAVAFSVPGLYNIISFSQNEHTERLLGLIKSATYHAHASGLILVFFLVLLYFNFKKLTLPLKVGSLATAVIMATGIYFTFTRGIWLSVSVSILIFLFFQKRKLFFGSIIAGLILITLLYNISPKFNARVQHSLQTSEADIERWNLIRVHSVMIQEHPLTGIGYFNSLSHTEKWWPKIGLPESYNNSHAHNQFLNVLATTGILGFIPFALFYFWFLAINVQLVKKFKLENSQTKFALAMACLITQVEFFIANFTDIGFEYTKIRSLILLVWALVFCLWQNRLQISDSAPAQN